MCLYLTLWILYEWHYGFLPDENGKQRNAQKRKMKQKYKK